MANNNYPQITSVTSEALQAQIRNLLPSQQGFGTDLMAQNVIVPIIDLTSAAEGSSVPENLQTALAFGSQTSFSASNSTVVVANSTGFWRITGAMAIWTTGSASICTFRGSDGISNKIYYEWVCNPTGAAPVFTTQIYDFVVFLAAGQSISAISNDTRAYLVGSSRQIADVNGVLVNPSGFSPQ